MLIGILHSVGLNGIFKCSSLPTELHLKSSQIRQDSIVSPKHSIPGEKYNKKRRGVGAGVSVHQLLLNKSIGNRERLPVHPVSGQQIAWMNSVVVVFPVVVYWCIISNA